MTFKSTTDYSNTSWTVCLNIVENDIIFVLSLLFVFSKKVFKIIEN